MWIRPRSTSGSGSYLSTAGGTMTGPITLPGNPVAALQAATKQYVDTGIAPKADLMAGVVPASELGSGTATAGSCLLGTGTSSSAWGACGGGSGSGNVSTIPVASQNVAQPAGTQFSVNNLANIRYVTASWNWSQTPSDSLSTAGSNTIHLSPCPLGVDTSGSTTYLYKVRITGTGTAENALVTGGSCTPGASSGTMTITTANTHAAGYTVGSASSGIQEAWNDAWVNDSGAAPNANSQAGPYVKLVADTLYSVYATVYLRGRGGELDGAGALIECSTRDRCIYIGTTQSLAAVNYHKLYNLSGGSTISVDGVQVASVSATSGTYTVNTASDASICCGRHGGLRVSLAECGAALEFPGFERAKFHELHGTFRVFRICDQRQHIWFLQHSEHFHREQLGSRGGAGCTHFPEQSRGDGVFQLWDRKRQRSGIHRGARDEPVKLEHTGYGELAHWGVSVSTHGPGECGHHLPPQFGVYGCELRDGGREWIRSQRYGVPGIPDVRVSIFRRAAAGNV